MYDFLIVGGGPAGLSSAHTLSKAGAKVLIIERKREIGRPVECGEGISEYEHRMMDVKGEYIVWKSDGVELVFPKGSIVVRQRMFSIDRYLFDRALSDMASSSGADIRTGEGVNALKKEKKGWYVRTEKGDEYRGRYLIAADGYRSWVGSTIGVYERRDVIAGTSTRGRVEDAGEMFRFFFSSDFPHGYGYIFPRAEDRVNAGVVLKGKNVGFIDNVFLKRHSIVPLERRGGGIPYMYRLRRYYDYRSFFVGDAAGLANSITYGGIYPAVMSGRIAGNVGLRAMESDEDYPKEYERKLRKADFFQKDSEKEHEMVYSMSEREFGIIGEIADGKELSEISFFSAFVGLHRRKAISMLPRLIRLYLYFRRNSDRI